MQHGPSRDKFAAVLETAALNEADLAAYCRQRGLYAEQIQAWRTACEQANDWERASSRMSSWPAACRTRRPSRRATRTPHREQQRSDL
jgi:hypothetical protein